jgi:hypothetical protein
MCEAICCVARPCWSRMRRFGREMAAVGSHGAYEPGIEASTLPEQLAANYGQRLSEQIHAIAPQADPDNAPAR